MRIEKPYIYCDFSQGKTPWYLKDTVGIEFGPTGSTVNDMDFMSRMSGADIVNKAVEANAEYLILFCKDSEYTYYKSKYRPSPESLGGRDLLAEVCEAAKGRDIKILSYAVVQYDSYARKNHPEWELKNGDGNGLYRLCLRSPGYIDEMKNIVDELTDYDIIGLHIDMMDIGFDTVNIGCWCEHCKSEFKKLYGYDMPSKLDMDDPRSIDFMEFRYTNNRNMALGLTEFVKNKRPDMSVDFNYHGAPPFSYEVGQRPVQHAGYGDFTTGESLPWIFGYNNTSLMSHFLDAANPNIPFQVVSSRSIYNYHEYTLRPTEDLRFEVMNAISNGALFTLVDKAGYNGWFDPIVYKRVSGIFGEARRKAAYVRGYRKEALCAVYFSHKTRDYVFRGSAKEYQNSIAGLAHMLVQEKINYSFIFDENATLGELKKYPLIILSNTGIISKNEADMFCEYVKNGGNLIATGPVGLFNNHGLPADKCALSEVLGIEYEGIANESNDTYLVFPDEIPEKYKDILNGIEGGYQLYCRDKLYKFKASASAETFGEAYIGFRPGRGGDFDNINADIWNQLMSAGIRKSEAIFLNSFGKGRTITLPCVPEKAYMGSHRSPELRKLMCNLVRRLAAKPSIEINAPLNTEVVVTHDDTGGKILVHLTTYNPALPVIDCTFNNDRKSFPPVMEDAMMYRAALKVNVPFESAYSVDGTPLEIKGDTIEFVTKQVYEIIIINR